MFERRRKRRVAGGVATLAVTALAAAACGSSPSSPSTSTTSVKGAVATLTNVSGTAASCMFPMETSNCYSVINYEDFQYLLVRPLYVFGGNSNTSISVDTTDNVGPAAAPIYSNGGKTVVVNLKPSWKWSNGQPVNAQDVIFFMNMLEANKASYAGYTPGLLPDNLVSYKATGPDQVTFQLKQAYSSIWFTYNQLAILYPFPLTWDTTSATGKADSGGCLTDSAADGWAKCKAVWKFLDAQNKATSSYATNPLWQVVDGPYKLTAYDVSGNYTLVPNTAYSGAPKPQVTLKFEEATSDAAVYTGLKTGQYSTSFPTSVPLGDLAPAASNGTFLPPSNPLASQNYALDREFEFGTGFAYMNFNNPTYGPVFKQLYFRQALMYLNNQLGMATAGGRGYAYPTPAGVPPYPRSQWVTPAMTANSGQGPYPYNVAAAQSLLAAHGWKVVGGLLTCQSSACGSGVKVGTQAKFSLLYTSGVAFQQSSGTILKSGFAQAGIQLTLVPETFDTLLKYTIPCHGSGCTWTFLYLGGWLFNGPGFEPTGEPLYQSGVPNNSGSYSDPKMNSLINATHTSSSISAFSNYATYTAQQVPSLWMPWQTNVIAVSNNMHNVTMNPLLTFYPEFWTCSTKNC
jgi:peptide/nickel transport system substrate-binding protein